MNEIVKCLHLLSATEKMLKAVRILFFAVTGIFAFRISKSVFSIFKSSKE